MAVVGKLADMLLVDGDPSADITVLQEKDRIKRPSSEENGWW